MKQTAIQKYTKEADKLISTREEDIRAAKAAIEEAEKRVSQAEATITAFDVSKGDSVFKAAYKSKMDAKAELEAAEAWLEHLEKHPITKEYSSVLNEIFAEMDAENIKAADAIVEHVKEIHKIGSALFKILNEGNALAKRWQRDIFNVKDDYFHIKQYKDMSIVDWVLLIISKPYYSKKLGLPENKAAGFDVDPDDPKRNS